MIFVMWRVMALGLWRDKGGLVLAFILPPVVFIVFASVFGGGVSGRLDVKAGVFDQAPNEQIRRLTGALNHQLGGRLKTFPTRSALLDAMGDGRVDAGLILAGDRGPDAVAATVLIHPGRRAAGEVLTAQVNAVAARVLPDVMMQREIAGLEPVLALSAQQRGRLRDTPALPTQTAFVQQEVLAGGDPIVVYYAGAVSVLFLMFSCMQGAMSLIDERRTGMRLRLGLSAGGVAPLLVGRLLWLVCLGVAQASVLFGVAVVVYRIHLFESLAPWLMTAVCAAAAAAGISLFLASACRTREQAQTASTFVILLLAAVGGSMAPRFLMPAALQTLGWLTPHAWVIDAYQTVLWRRVVDGRVIEAWLVLAGFCAAGFAAAVAIESRRKL
jgi:ABC-2 type transport system permease protein